ncbi:MAG TPA: tyrosine-type recombinase/integrase [Polyangiaceae bacterium]
MPAVDVTNAANKLLEARYSAFVIPSLVNSTGSLSAIPFGFAGGLYDADTGLVRFGEVVGAAERAALESGVRDCGPRRARRLPKYVLSGSEVEQVLTLPDIDDVFGLRDRAMLETLYATGVRRKELLALKLNDIDHDRKVVMIPEGKGGHDRMVPIGERALGWIGKYIGQARADLMVPPDEGVLFLTRFSEAFRPSPLTNLVRQYVSVLSSARREPAICFVTPVRP